MENKINVVSGCPRSGTSSMTLCIGSSLDEDDLIGTKFPQEKKQNRIHDQISRIRKDDIREFYERRFPQEDSKDKKLEEIKDLNPQGFWECRYSVDGIRYHDGIPDLNGKYCKIVSQGVYRSNPNYIGKIVFMARCPRQVAKSQERLRRQVPDVVAHTPEMFIQVTAQISTWIINNKKEKDVLIVNYDNLIEQPRVELDRVADFLERPRNSFDHTLINPNLKRSEPEDIENHLWEVADKIFIEMLSGNWQNILNLHKQYRKVINRDSILTNCERLDDKMFYNECVNCIHNKTTRTTNRHRAESAGIDWIGKPCMFLCHTAPDIPLVKLQETIDKNHWLNDSDFVAPTLSRVGLMALSTICRVATDRLKGKKHVARKDIIADREEICGACPFRVGESCRACTCNLPKKVRIAQSKCPKDRWKT